MTTIGHPLYFCCSGTRYQWIPSDNFKRVGKTVANMIFKDLLGAGSIPFKGGVKHGPVVPKRLILPGS